MKGTVRLEVCDLLEIICGGQKPALPLLMTSARRGLASREGKDGVATV